MKEPLHRLPLDEWFDDVPHPHDAMPIAKDNPIEEDKEETIHEKMYQIATAKYNPFSIGGSESIRDIK
tara:strand:+ start:954 stop:1157 length:204 start_codon:yes stop_codon:yes gene_type:complete